jgi:Uma2 family endonuclease
MLQAWGELDMSTVARDLRLPAAVLIGLRDHAVRFEVIDGQLSMEADPDGDRWLFELLEEQGVRHELLDGLLLVTPPPSPRHEFAVAELFFQLRRQAPGGTLVFASNLGYYYGGSSYSLADVTVVAADALDAVGTRAPLLLVEVLSASSRRTDLLLKRELYAEHGVPSYWIIDPDALTLTVMSLRGTEYVEAARVLADAVLVVEEPFALTIEAAALWLPSS